MDDQRTSRGIKALALFFVFGSVMSGLAFFMLLFPDSPLEPLWRLNPKARQGFAGMGWWALLLMFVVCLGCSGAALGLWRRKRWGYWMALSILWVNVLADTINALLVDQRTLVGIPIAGALIAYLIAKRRIFGRRNTEVSSGFYKPNGRS
jgi:hypothetical protein